MPDLLTNAELADYLKIPAATPAEWRYKGTGPRYLKIGKHVRYRRDDVEAWLNSQIAS